jgi:hypothetical protein
LGPKGMYHCVKSHKCNKVCKALKLEEMDVEAERIYLKQIDRKRISGELMEVNNVKNTDPSSSSAAVLMSGNGIPIELELSRTTKQLDFNF